MRAVGARGRLAVLLAGLLAVGAVASQPSSAAEGPTLSVGDQSGLERDSVTGSVFMPIYLSAPASEPVVVSYWTVDGTATAGVDYARWGTLASPRTVTIPAGAVQTQVNVPILADDEVEADETFSLVATATGGGVVLGEDTGTATIVDADALFGPNPVITVSNPTVVEGDSGQRRAQFQVHLSRAPLSNVTISYTTTDGTAVAGEDYVAKLPGTVVFAPGQISKTVDVLVNSNSDVDGNRDFALDVSVIGGSPVEELTMSGTATIVDDDTATAVPCQPGTFNSTDGNEPCEPAPPGTFVDTQGATAATPCPPGTFQDQIGQNSCELAPIGSYVETSGAVEATLCPEGTTTTSEGATSVDDCVSPTAVPTIAAGDEHTCALLADTTVSCWGKNWSGQLGNGTTAPTGDRSWTTPGPVLGLSGVVDVVAGRDHSCAVLDDGTLRCWGSNGFGKLGNGSASGISNVPVAVVGITDAVAVSAGYEHTCALLEDGTARCWGRNGQVGVFGNLIANTGRLGNGTVTNSSVPVVVSGLVDVVEVSAGDGHSCALLADGTARCWGSNSGNVGVLGTGSTSSSSVPVAVSGLADAVTLSTRNSHTCVTLGNGTVRCWGFNLTGQLGNGTTSDSAVPVVVSGLTDVVDVAAGALHTCARLADATARCWGQNGGRLGDGTLVNSSVPVATSGLSGVTALTAGGSHSCASRDDGSATCWGRNNVGQLGNGTSGSDRDVPVQVSGLTGAVVIAAGANHACALLDDATMSCWGSNSTGQLGIGLTGGAENLPVAVAGLTGVEAIAASFNHTCALLADGTARCWGANSNGQLGDGTNINSTTPVAVSGVVGAVAIATGSSHTCVLLGDGSARCWGRNVVGQLGDGTATDSNVPVSVTGVTDATAITADDAHTCVVLADGTVRCWGSNGGGQLGDGTTVNSNVPVTAAGVVDVAAVSAGGQHTCAVLADGSARCWGLNSAGQLGGGTVGGTSSTPVTVSGLTGVAELVAGNNHSCAVLGDGTARCWGDNFAGKLGNGTTGGSSGVPVTVSGLANATGVSAGFNHSCAVSADGSGHCWGSNGQLGDGSGWSKEPSAVVGLG